MTIVNITYSSVDVLDTYILFPCVSRYADFLCRMNDDRNVRVLFERALSVLPAEESAEVLSPLLHLISS